MHADVKDAVWTTLQSLASAPKAERTLTGLAAHPVNALVAALAPYTLEGAYGRLLDGSAERLALSDELFQCKMIHTALTSGAHLSSSDWRPASMAARHC